MCHYWGEKRCTIFLLGVGCSAISALPLHVHSVTVADLPYQRVHKCNRNILDSSAYCKKQNGVWKREDTE